MRNASLFLSFFLATYRTNHHWTNVCPNLIDEQKVISLLTPMIESSDMFKVERRIILTPRGSNSREDLIEMISRRISFHPNEHEEMLQQMKTVPPSTSLRPNSVNIEISDRERLVRLFTIQTESDNQLCACRVSLFIEEKMTSDWNQIWLLGSHFSGCVYRRELSDKTTEKPLDRQQRRRWSTFSSIRSSLVDLDIEGHRLRRRFSFLYFSLCTSTCRTYRTSTTIRMDCRLLFVFVALFLTVSTAPIFVNTDLTTSEKFKNETTNATEVFAYDNRSESAEFSTGKDDENDSNEFKNELTASIEMIVNQIFASLSTELPLGISLNRPTTSDPLLAEKESEVPSTPTTEIPIPNESTTSAPVENN